MGNINHFLDSVDHEWIDKNNNHTPLKKLTDSHIRNIINMLQRRYDQTANDWDVDPQGIFVSGEDWEMYEAIRILEGELESREESGLHVFS